MLLGGFGKNGQPDGTIYGSARFAPETRKTRVRFLTDITTICLIFCRQEVEKYFKTINMRQLE